MVGGWGLGWHPRTAPLRPGHPPLTAFAAPLRWSEGGLLVVVCVGVGFCRVAPPRRASGFRLPPE